MAYFSICFRYVRGWSQLYRTRMMMTTEERNVNLKHLGGELCSKNTILHLYLTSFSTLKHRSFLKFTLSRWREDVIKWKKNFRVTAHLCGEFPAQRPVTRSFDVFFDLRLKKRLSKQWWLETPSRPLWRHCIGQGPLRTCRRGIISNHN